MVWRDGLFVHWPVDPDSLRDRVPDALELETYDGAAWVSVLPFVLSRVGIRGSPRITRFAFPELNVRTYVRFRGDSGLYFFSIDVDAPIVAAAVGRLSRLPVYNAQMRVGKSDERVWFSSERPPDESGTDDGKQDEPTTETVPRFAISYESNGATYRAEPGTLEHWLTERRRFYAPNDEDVLTGEIAHEPWPLEPVAVTIHENTLFATNGLPEPIDDPVAAYCETLPMTGSIPRRVRRP